MLYYTGLIPYAGPYATFMAHGCGEPATMTSQCWKHFNKAYNLAGSWSQGLASHRSSQTSIQRNRRMDKLRSRFPSSSEGELSSSEDELNRDNVPDRGTKSTSEGSGTVATLQPSFGSEALNTHEVVPASPTSTGTTTIKADVTRTDPTTLVRLDKEPDYDPDNKYGSFCTGNSSLDYAVLPNANGGGCLPLGSNLERWLNRADVKAALHVNVTHAPLGGSWTECTEGHGWSYATSETNVVTAYYEPLFRHLDASRFRVLVYSGIEDIGVVTPAETQQCVAELSAAAVGNRTQHWQPWRRDGTPLGYWEAHERLTFATIKGAGHMAPTNQPVAAAQMLYRWLLHNDLGHSATDRLFAK